MSELNTDSRLSVLLQEVFAAAPSELPRNAAIVVVASPQALYDARQNVYTALGGATLTRAKALPFPLPLYGPSNMAWRDLLGVGGDFPDDHAVAQEAVSCLVRAFGAQAVIGGWARTAIQSFLALRQVTGALPDGNAQGALDNIMRQLGIVATARTRRSAVRGVIGLAVDVTYTGDGAEASCDGVPLAEYAQHLRALPIPTALVRLSVSESAAEHDMFEVPWHGLWAADINLESTDRVPDIGGLIEDILKVASGPGAEDLAPLIESCRADSA